MDRGLKAAFLFSLILVAQADRALTAHKPNGGGLHAVAVLRTPIVTPGATVISSQVLETTFSTIGNYLITNGNGSWTYSYYANNGNLNNNDAGMGDYFYTNQNPVWFNANGAVGTQTGATIVLGNIHAALYIPSYDLAGVAPAAGSTTITAGQIASPVSLYTTGINDMVFTGAKTGVAVGVFGGYQDYEQVTFSNLASQVAQIGTFQAGTAPQTPKMNVLLSFDGATTWVRASGLPALSSTTATLVPGAITNFGSYPHYLSAGTFGTASTIPPYPTLSCGDLTAVKMASKTMGWAVGGNDNKLGVTVSSNAGLGPGTTFANSVLAGGIAAASPGAVPLGLILMTQNGGTVWKNIPIYISYSSLLPLWKNNDASLKTIFSTPIPGILYGVDSDASGKHVFAVGSGSSLYSTVAATFTYLTGNSAAALGVQVKPFGTILYSGNSGMSWVQQSAPTLYSGVAPYTLFDIAVQKGTTAVTVGGSPHVKFGAIAAGTILYTSNGGFSWTQAVYPGSTGSKAPVFTSVTFQPSAAGVQTVWVGGFTTRVDVAVTIALAAGALPLAQGTAAVTVGSSDFFPVAAVAGYTPTGTGGSVSVVSSGVPRTKGSIYTILVSKDMGKTFAAAPTSGMPTGFVVTSYMAPTSVTSNSDRSVYGITWDNAMHGWIYGYGYIISTQNGGATWVYETPSDVGVLTVTPAVTVVASVPTTY